MRPLIACGSLLVSFIASGCGDDVTQPEKPQVFPKETQLTSGPASDGVPRWSPDGQTIAFDRWTGVGNVWTVPSKGGVPKQLTSYVNDYDPDWSPDGTQILFGSTRSGSNDIWLLTLRDSVLINLIALPRNDLGPRWSPDGTMIAFTSDSQVGPFGVWLYSLSENLAWPILVNDRYSFGVNDWSPDGKWLAVDGGEASELWLLPIAGGDRKRLTENGERVFDFGADFSPDGTKIAFVSSRSGNDDIWLMNLSNLSVAQLTFDPTYDLSPDWSPDGNRIAYGSSRTGNGDLWILDVPKHPRWIKQTALP